MENKYIIEIGDDNGNHTVACYLVGNDNTIKIKNPKLSFTILSKFNSAKTKSLAMDVLANNVTNIIQTIKGNIDSPKGILAAFNKVPGFTVLGDNGIPDTPDNTGTIVIEFGFRQGARGTSIYCTEAKHKSACDIVIAKAAITIKDFDIVNLDFIQRIIENSHDEIDSIIYRHSTYHFLNILDEFNENDAVINGEVIVWPRVENVANVNKCLNKLTSIVLSRTNRVNMDDTNTDINGDEDFKGRKL